ncbi:VOC family protein [Candidatus Solirubrobacter pratensis]|uniref:VOC family protein n=1 Tax=Candidatus Solirubrobacter pratensis TaxID=1298857 RepID=UPI0004192680|nr:VOC family protein [Candidatus Solirubrobacter pratensis]
MSVSVRYILDDVDSAIAFYRDQLGFEVVMRPAPPFAMLARGDLRLLLSAPNPQGGRGQTLPDGRVPEPGGWSRFQLEVEDLDAEVDRLSAAGVTLRSDIVRGRGGDQVIADDPSGNPVELFQPH